MRAAEVEVGAEEGVAAEAIVEEAAVVVDTEVEEVVAEQKCLVLRAGEVAAGIRGRLRCRDQVHRNLHPDHPEEAVEEGVVVDARHNPDRVDSAHKQSLHSVHRGIDPRALPEAEADYPALAEAVAEAEAAGIGQISIDPRSAHQRPIGRARDDREPSPVAAVGTLLVFSPIAPVPVAEAFAPEAMGDLEEGGTARISLVEIPSRPCLEAEIARVAAAAASSGDQATAIRSRRVLALAVVESSGGPVEIIVRDGPAIIAREDLVAVAAENNGAQAETTGPEGLEIGRAPEEVVSNGVPVTIAPSVPIVRRALLVHNDRTIGKISRTRATINGINGSRRTTSTSTTSKTTASITGTTSTTGGMRMVGPDVTVRTSTGIGAAM